MGTKPMKSHIQVAGRGGVFNTTPETITMRWRDAREKRLIVTKSAVWTDELAWEDVMEHLKLFIENPPKTEVSLALETFSGGIILGYSIDWEKSQVSSDGEVILLRSRISGGLSFAVASADKYREGFDVEGLDNVRGVRLIMIAVKW